ncbi:nitrilase-related carbon-nitrogen hydrolase [Roseateles sp. BYS180W]|uniref:Nitrilase-related carbon-nitrogen hydrolase n=1 Tax=Roseateles rivi TaxID=3299028 RepID=A0ABW7FTX7_9BURK
MHITLLPLRQATTHAMGLRALRLALAQVRPSQLLVLPGQWLNSAERPLAPAAAQALLEELSSWAAQHRCLVFSGSWWEQSPGAPRCASYLLDERGELLHSLIRRQHGSASSLPVVDTALGRLGLLNANDVWAWESTRVQSLQGAQLVLVAGQLGAHQQRQQEAALWGLATLSCVGIAFASAASAQDPGLLCLALPDGVRGRSQDSAEPLHLALDPACLPQLRDADLTFRNTLWFGLWSRRKELYAPLTQAPHA